MTFHNKNNNKNNNNNQPTITTTSDNKMQPTHLVIVPGHGIWKFTNKGQHCDDWFLESFQVEGNDHLIFIKHIETGLRLIRDDPESLLMFSGGQTKIAAGAMSEAQSYYFLAKELLRGLSLNESMIERCYTEQYARDSFENVLFSIARFKQITGEYPKRITISGFEFKKYRFINLHLKTLKFNMDSIGYVGIDPSPDYDKESREWIKYFQELKDSEYKYAASEFEKDPLGNGTVLGKKKTDRNPFNTSHGYLLTSRELLPFFGDSSELGDVQVPWISS